MSACPLLNPLEKHLEILVVFGLSRCMATVNNTVGNGNVFVGFFKGKGVENSKKDRSASNCT